MQETKGDVRMNRFSQLQCHIDEAIGLWGPQAVTAGLHRCMGFLFLAERNTTRGRFLSLHALVRVTL